jgi:hypothetical protein
MLGLTDLGFGMRLRMLVRESPRHRLWLFDLPTVRVSGGVYFDSMDGANDQTDANLFKEAFIKAQQENEVIFKATE